MEFTVQWEGRCETGNLIIITAQAVLGAMKGNYREEIEEREANPCPKSSLLPAHPENGNSASRMNPIG